MLSQVAKKVRIQQCIHPRYLRTETVQHSEKFNPHAVENERVDEEWINAKPYNEIPGPPKWLFPLSFFPGGKFHNLALLDMHRKLREVYGPIIRLHGTFGREDMVFLFEPDSFEKVFRTEGMWPIRKGLDTFLYYRKQVRPEIFKNVGGLVTEQGESWAELRTKVNPILMKPKTVYHHLAQVNEVAIEFLGRIEKIRDPTTLEVPENFGNEVNRWSLESTGVIALNTRLGLINNFENNPNGEKLMRAVKDFFQMSYELDVLPSFWKYIKTPTLKKLMKTFDIMTDTTISYINETVKKFESQDQSKVNEDSLSVLEKLLKVDKQSAIVMAMDMLLAGVDTTSSAFISCLFRLAKSPEKQIKLRQEILEIMPNKDSPLKPEQMANLPYLRACIKEALRMTAITSGNFRETAQDLVLQGYKIPKGTGVVMGGTVLANDEAHFPRSIEFLPERWLRQAELHAGCPSAKTAHPFIYLPFGFGPRTCIGRRIAEMKIEIMLLRVIRNYSVSWNYPDIKYRSNLINSPVGPLQFKFEDVLD